MSGSYNAKAGCSVEPVPTTTGSKVARRPCSKWVMVPPTCTAGPPCAAVDGGAVTFTIPAVAGLDLEVGTGAETFLVVVADDRAGTVPAVVTAVVLEAAALASVGAVVV